MNEKRFGLGTVLYVFNENISNVLLLGLKEIKRNKFGADWGNVGGKVNPGEASLENCIREAEEEIGVLFRPKDLTLIKVCEIPSFSDRVHAVQFIYGAIMPQSTPITLGSELESYAWFSLPNLPARTLDAKEEYYAVQSRLREIKKIF